jgi:serine/threonine protein kinase
MSSPQAPSTIGPYRVLRRLGSGAAGTVYEACAEGASESVAVKVMTANPGNPDLLARFRREVTLLRDHPHPDLLSVLDAQLDEEPFYLVSPVLSGGSLADHADPSRRLPVPKALAAAAAVARALAHLHAHGVVHRDVKPANVLRTAEGRSVLGDLGLGRAEGSEKLTRTGYLVGTPYYLPPEVLVDPERGQDPAGDVYALGVTLAWLLVGESPVRSVGHLDVPWEEIRRTRIEGLPRLLGDILAANPEERPPAREVATRLEEMVARGPGPAAVAETQTHQRTLPPEALDEPPPPEGFRLRLPVLAPLALLLAASLGVLQLLPKAPAMTTPHLVEAPAPSRPPPALDAGRWARMSWVRALGREAIPLEAVPGPPGEVTVAVAVIHRDRQGEARGADLVVLQLPEDPQGTAPQEPPRVTLHPSRPEHAELEGLAADARGAAVLVPGPYLLMLGPQLQPRFVLGEPELGALSELRLLGVTRRNVWLASGARVLAVSRGAQAVVHNLQARANVVAWAQDGGGLRAGLDDGSWVQLLDPEST